MTAFSNPVKVVIQGYTGIAMEPCISPDDALLLFNNSNSGGNTDLHFAYRGADPKTFSYAGKVAGVINTMALEAVPSMSAAADLYFISNRSYMTDFETTYMAHFDAAGVRNVATVTGLSKKTHGWLIMDSFITLDGNALFFCDAQMSATGQLLSSRIVLGTKVATAQFTRSPASDALLQTINATGKNYAPAISADGLEFFWTSLRGPVPAIYTASRPNTTLPFGPAVLVSAATGFVEAPAISTDGKRLYYHHAIPSGGFEIMMASR